MAHYLVNAIVDPHKLAELKERLDSGEIKAMRPFGNALDYSLRHARIEAGNRIVWEEEDYCRPPLAMERAAVLDTYFSHLTTESVEAGAGWQQIDHLKPLWP